MFEIGCESQRAKWFCQFEHDLWHDVQWKNALKLWCVQTKMIADDVWMKCVECLDQDKCCYNPIVYKVVVANLYFFLEQRKGKNSFRTKKPLDWHTA